MVSQDVPPFARTHLSLNHVFFSLNAFRQRRVLFLRIILLVLGLLALLQTLPMFPQTATAHAATISQAYQSTFTVDAVTVQVNAPFIMGKWATSPAGNMTQLAQTATADLAGTLTVTAVPYGTRPRSEGVLAAQPGGADNYRAFLLQYRTNAGDQPQTGPTIQLFGQAIQGLVSLRQPLDPTITQATVIYEWVVEAGQRIWLIRVTQLQQAGIKSLAQLSSAFTTMQALSMSSNTLNQPTTIDTSLDAMAATLSSTPLDSQPSWWNGSVCDDAYTFANYGVHSTQLGTDHYHDLIVCGPLSKTIARNFGIGATNDEWQCVELVMRYLYLAYNIPPYLANGNTVVNNYFGTALVSYLNGTVNHAPEVGDILSYDTYTIDPAHTTGRLVRKFGGHTSIVTARQIDDHGNGWLEVLQQNSSYLDKNGKTVVVPTERLSVTNWQVTVNGWSAIVLDWLHPTAALTVNVGSASSDPGNANSNGVITHNPQ